jgi:hypothetical protein
MFIVDPPPPHLVIEMTVTKKFGCFPISSPLRWLR